MARLLCILVSLILCSVNGLAVYSFAGNHEYEAPQFGLAEDDTWTDSDYDDAEIALQAALLTTQGDFNKQLPVLQGLADVYHGRKKYEEEKASLLALIRAMYSIDDYPIIPLAAQHLRLSTVYFSLEDYRNAASAGQIAVDLFKRSSGQESTNLALAYNNLGWIELKREELDSALGHFEKSLSILSKTVGKKSLLYGLIAENLGALYTKKEDHRSAFIWYRASLRTLGDYLTKDDPVAIELQHRCNQARTLSRTANNQHAGKSKSRKELAGENKLEK